LNERLYELDVRKRITRSLQKQHRNCNLEQVFAALVRQTAGGMKRESEKH
jgi:hypothetical protein